MYEVAYQATYLFETMNWDGSLTRWQARVDVLGETEKSYIIRVREPVRGHVAGEVMRVMKKKVRFPKAPVDPTQYWFNNFESRELPFQNS